jgi:exonuclease SbcC
LAERLSDLRRTAELAESKRAEAEQHAAVADAAAAEQAARLEQLSAQVAQARGEHASIAERVQALTAQAESITTAADALDAAARAAERLPADAERPNLAALRQAEEGAGAEAYAALQTLTLAVQRLATLRNASERHAEALVAAGPLLERRALTRALFELVDGIGADNRLRMKLSAYVLAAKLDAVAKAATARLLQMSSGRYSLTHRAERGRSNKRGGLELRVIDAHTGEEREARSLSGGEKFYASLALALGLADVITAEAGGSRLDTLFIDEGFGSLDESTLDEVLGVLDTLRSGGRVVGVVSHVRELRERIGAQLQIKKAIDGSTVHQNTQPDEQPVTTSAPTLREELERALPKSAQDAAEAQPAAPAALF